MPQVVSQSSIEELPDISEDNRPNYERLILALGFAWVMTIVIDLYFGRDFIKSISFQVQDATWLPENVGPSRALVGLHHFGDYQIWLGYAAIYNPFADFIKYPPQSPPQLLWFFKSLLKLGFQPFLGIPKTLLGFWIASFGTWIHSLRKSVRELEIGKIELRLYAAASILSAPFIVTFDRGSLQFLVVASCLLFIHAVNDDRKVTSAVFFVTAISLKPYCALFLIWPLMQRKWMVLLGSVSSAVIVTFAALWTLPGSIHIAVKSFLKAIAGHVAGQDMTWLSDSVSAPASLWKISRILKIEPLIQALEADSGVALMGTSLLVLISLVLIVSSRASTNRLSIIVLFSSTQLVVPLSGLYTPLWAVALIPLLIRESSTVNFRKLSDASATQTLAALFSMFALISLLPLPGSTHVSNYAFRYCALIAPLGMTLTIIPLAFFVVLESLKTKRK